MKMTRIAWVVALGWTMNAIAAEPEKTPAPTDSTKAAATTTATTKPTYTILIDTSDVPEMAEYAKRVQRVAEEWYPKLIPMLPSEGFKPHPTVTIVFKKEARAIAAAGGDRITAQQAWFTKNPNDLGAFVHELVHVVQSYPRRITAGATRPPGWLVEGIADYIRFFRYEPESARPHPNPKDERTNYDASYRVSGHFLNWAQEKYDKDLVVKLNAACRQGKYKPELWKEYTGKTVEELGAEWKASLPARK
jgi:hypothetical protein